MHKIIPAIIVTALVCFHTSATMLFVPNADFVCFVNTQSLNQSAFAKFIEEKTQPFTQNQSVSGLPDKSELLKTFGLDEDSVESVFIAANLSRVNPMTGQAPAPDNIDLLASVNLKSALDINQLAEAIKMAGAPLEAQSNMFKYKNIDVVQVQTTNPQTGTAMKFACFLINNGRCLVAGPEHSVQAAIDRAANRQNIKPTSAISELKTHAPSSSNFYMAYVLSPDVRKMLQADTAPQPGQPPARDPMSMAKKAGADLRGVCLAINCASDLDTRVTVRMGSDATAQQFTQFLDSMVISAAKMFLANSGQQLQFVNTLKAETVPKSCTRLSATLNQADIDALMAMAGGTMMTAPGGGSGSAGTPPNNSLQFDLTE
jgi:hypothetical protein